MFHGQFLGYFHGRKIFFTDGDPKIDKKFHGRHFDFHGEKKNAAPDNDDVIGCNQWLCLPKAELKTKNSTKR